MATTDTLQLDALLEPIPGDNPAGEDLREDDSADSLYQQIKTARSNARAAERLRDSGSDGMLRPDWRLVFHASCEALAGRSKDLEIAAYLIEALVREQGFAACAMVFEIVRELVERYWDDLYPRPDGDGVSTRVAHIAGLNGVGSEGTLIRPILMCPITGGDPRALLCRLSASSTVERARCGGTKASSRGRHRLDGPVYEGCQRNPDRVVSADPRRPPAVSRRVSRDLSRLGSKVWRACSAFVEYPQRAGDLPRNDQLRRRGRASRRRSRRRRRRSTGAGFSRTKPNWHSATAHRPPLRPIRGREEALQTLEQVAEFFRRTEPHSPISYAADRLARWGRLPLPALLNELIPDPQSRGYVNSLVGMDETEA